MIEIYDDHEQGQRVQAWLKENGSAIFMGIGLAVAGYFGFKYWQNYQDSRKVNAAAEYYALSQALIAENLDLAVDSYETLKAENQSSPYAALAALQIAKARLESKQLDLAVADYRYALDHAQPDALRLVARERLARVLVDQQKYEEALAVLDEAADINGFEARYAETRGDILLQQGKAAEARAAYQTALDSLEDGVGNRNLLQMKIDSLVVADLDGNTDSES